MEVWRDPGYHWSVFIYHDSATSPTGVTATKSISSPPSLSVLPTITFLPSFSQSLSLSPSLSVSVSSTVSPDLTLCQHICLSLTPFPWNHSAPFSSSADCSHWSSSPPCSLVSQFLLIFHHIPLIPFPLCCITALHRPHHFSSLHFYQQVTPTSS